MKRSLTCLNVAELDLPKRSRSTPNFGTLQLDCYGEGAGGRVGGGDFKRIRPGDILRWVHRPFATQPPGRFGWLGGSEVTRASGRKGCVGDQGCLNVVEDPTLVGIGAVGGGVGGFVGNGCVNEGLTSRVSVLQSKTSLNELTILEDQQYGSGGGEDYFWGVCSESKTDPGGGGEADPCHCGGDHKGQGTGGGDTVGLPIDSASSDEEMGGQALGGLREWQPGGKVAPLATEQAAVVAATAAGSLSPCQPLVPPQEYARHNSALPRPLPDCPPRSTIRPPWPGVNAAMTTQAYPCWSSLAVAQAQFSLSVPRQLREKRELRMPTLSPGRRLVRTGAGGSVMPAGRPPVTAENILRGGQGGSKTGGGGGGSATAEQEDLVALLRLEALHMDSKPGGGARCIAAS